MMHRRNRKNRNRTLHIGLMAVLLSAAYTSSQTGWAASGSAAAAPAPASGVTFGQAGTRLSGDTAAGHEHHHAHEEGHNQSVTVQWSFLPKQPEAGNRAAIQLNFKDAHGRPVQSFDLNHEREIHLIAVSSDLSEFQHLHPVDEGQGHFTVDTVFPKGGAYKLFADFVPAGGSHQVARTEVTVGGKTTAAVPLVPDKRLVQTVQSTVVSLHTGELQAGKETALAFSFKDAGTGRPVPDMEPYLGAAGHVVIVSSDLRHYLHVHPKEGQTAGPEALFETTFPSPGIYKVWGQFQRHGDLLTSSFTIKVGEQA
ncbi:MULTISPECIES: hypothetical protein [unclassified Paenibacillus]|uniref:hypothetical protein n=1 Tax=unclassified Paenibacillus TaxID=185978 RepID=UPI001046E56C|nr:MULTISPECIES: hypothetical protein [unclassified Paenibacillus]NIK70754.1 hypothetical protein [Paenibacillus sp. BK720]TCM93274.1 hypothetical protein EV294_107226 [Paenibacillus sp. BK033]